MSDMVERVARALVISLGYDPDVLVQIIPDDPATEPVWKNLEAEARAAIEAMREPTEAMVAAIAKQEYTIEHYHGSGHHRTFPTLGSGPIPAYRAMIDAALSEAP